MSDLMKFSINTSAMYGVRPIDIRNNPISLVSNAEICFNGIPVHESDMCVERKYREKRWKRTNRPDKVKTKIIQIPTLYLSEIDGTKRIYCHPSIARRLWAMN